MRKVTYKFQECKIFVNFEGRKEQKQTIYQKSDETIHK